MALGVAIFSWLDHLSGSDLNLMRTITWINIRFGADIHDAESMNVTLKILV